MSEVKMIPVKSSNLKAIGWVAKDPKNMDIHNIDFIRVEFQRGDSYYYWPVTKKEYEQGIAATNVSEWFNAFKVGKQFTKL